MSTISVCTNSGQSVPLLLLLVHPSSVSQCQNSRIRDVSLHLFFRPHACILPTGLSIFAQCNLCGCTGCPTRSATPMHFYELCVCRHKSSPFLKPSPLSVTVSRNVLLLDHLPPRSCARSSGAPRCTIAIVEHGPGLVSHSLGTLSTNHSGRSVAGSRFPKFYNG